MCGAVGDYVVNIQEVTRSPLDSLAPRLVLFIVVYFEVKFICNEREKNDNLRTIEGKVTVSLKCSVLVGK